MPDLLLTEEDIAAAIEASEDTQAGEALLDGPLFEHALDLGAVAERAASAAGVTLSERNVFDERGVARIVVIRPCVSRGKRIRGLPPIYTPRMLEANAAVFTGWPMYFDHHSQRLREMLEEAGRSVRELAGQILRAWWDPSFSHPDDARYGYQRGAVLAEAWGTPLIRQIVANNPNLLHTSINAWPKAGKEGRAPWDSKVRGMVIEGIRGEPQGSVDFVPRPGAGGRLLAEDEALVVSAVDRVYNSGRAMPPTKNDTPDFAKMNPSQLREWAEENAPHLAEAIQAEGANGGNGGGAPARQPEARREAQAAGLTEADVQRMIEAAREPADPKADEKAQEKVREAADEAIKEAREQEALSRRARELIEAAEGLTAGFKAALIERYAVAPTGPAPALLVEEDDQGKDGAHRTKLDVLEANVKADIQHQLDLIAEAKGKPRVKGEGGGDPNEGGAGKAKSLKERRSDAGKTPFWREQFADMGIVESADDALAIHGVEKVED